MENEKIYFNNNFNLLVMKLVYNFTVLKNFGPWDNLGLGLLKHFGLK